MKLSNTTLTLVALAILGGCAAPTTGIQPIGSGIYMSSKLGSMMTFNGSEVTMELFKEAGEFCRKQGKEVEPVSSKPVNSGMGTYASGEIQFRCK